MNCSREISKEEFSKWILYVAENSLMLTISEPHAKTKHLELTVENMQPIISKIVLMANNSVFTKHKHFEFLRGVVVAENVHKQPHFHILFKKPNGLEFDKFESRLTKVANKLCNAEFHFDLTDSYLNSRIKYFLSNPCYDRFAKVSNTHEFTGNYLTKQYAYYYVLDDRGVKFADTQLHIFVKV